MIVVDFSSIPERSTTIMDGGPGPAYPALAGKIGCLPRGHLLYSRQQPASQGESEVREAFMSVREGSAAYSEDMTPSANAELGDSGACRRR